jgi:NTE family protein
VIDRLLADGRIKIEAVTGASAGAMNAVVLAEGLSSDSHEQARKVLRQFWEGVAQAAMLSPLRSSPLDLGGGAWSVDHSPAYVWFDLVSRLASPYELNPFNWNPLRDLIDRLVDFEQVRACKAVQVFVSATNVETGRPKIFRRHELTADHVLASACLPFLSQAVVIDGAAYWDGGYMGNPPLWPLFEFSPADDVVVVQINPIQRPGVPRRAREIADRMNEITFNASLLRELRAIDFVTRLIDDGRLEGTGYRRVLVHMIADEATLVPLGASSKLNAEMPFLDMLFAAGSAAADRWLSGHFDDIGQRSTINISELLQGEEDALDGARIRRRAVFQTEPTLESGRPRPHQAGR